MRKFPDSSSSSRMSCFLLMYRSPIIFARVSRWGNWDIYVMGWANHCDSDMARYSHIGYFLPVHWAAHFISSVKLQPSGLSNVSISSHRMIGRRGLDRQIIPRKLGIRQLDEIKPRVDALMCGWARKN